MNLLESSWGAAWRDLALPAPPRALFDALLASWAEPQRGYHTSQHLEECLAHFADDRALARHPGEVGLALWFHDAVHEPARHDNEARSAAWARRELAAVGARDEIAERVHALVMATCHRERPCTDDERLLVDIDLAILGAEPARFDEYERQVRAEYDFVPEAVFRAKRHAVLQGFDARHPIYETAAYRERLEAAAHANLQRSLGA